MRKLLVTVLTSLLLLTGITSQPAYAACTLSGSGSSSDPWLIDSAAKLAKVGVIGASECLTNGYDSNRYYKLTSDIVLAGNFAPLELYANDGYIASFDGNNKIISGLNVVAGIATQSGNFPNGNYSGLFSNTRNAFIKDLKITGHSVVGDSYVGALAGYAQSTTIQNITVDLTGSVSGETSMGLNHGQMVGGLVGGLYNSTLTRATFTGSGVFGGAYSGGGIGDSTNSSVSKIAIGSDVDCLNISGGVIGSVNVESSTIFDELYYHGSMRGDQYVGGLIGYVWGSNDSVLTISNSGVRGVIATASTTYSPSAFVGEVGNRITATNLVDSYMSASFAKNTSTVVDTVALKQGLSTLTGAHNYFESWSANSAVSTGAQLVSDGVLDELSDVTGWSVVQQDTSVKVDSGSSWVVDGSAGPLNGGRPMTASAYNLGFYGAVVNRCEAGTYSNTGGVPCVPSESGRYVAISGQTEATQCPAGSYQVQTGQTHCLLASSGYFVSAIGSITQVPCPSGTTSDVGAVNCVAIASGGGGGGGASSPTVSEPLLITKPSVSGQISIGGLLRIDKGVWKSDWPLTYTYKWFKCSKPVVETRRPLANSSCAEIIAQVSPWYETSSTDLETFLVFEVKASDGTAESYFTSKSVNSPSLKYLVMKTAPKILGIAKVGKTLTLSNAIFENSKPKNLKIQWFRCNTSVLSTEKALPLMCIKVPGAVSQTYKISTKDHGKFLTATTNASLGSWSVKHSPTTVRVKK